jgi:hypothetical protein
MARHEERTMSDHRDFEEPVAAPDATSNEKSTRWVLTACFGILILAGLAFASVGKIGKPIESAFLSDTDQQPPPQATAPRGVRMPPPPGLSLRAQ